MAGVVLPIADKLLGIVDKLLENSNIKLAQRPIERVREKRLAILNERAKGDLADQQMIAALYQELDVELDALKTAIESGATGGKS